MADRNIYSIARKQNMQKFKTIFFVFILGVFVVSQEKASKTIVFKNVNVIDVIQASVKKNMMVVIAGDTIDQIGKEGKVVFDKEAQVIDASNKFLIPGLWDMHVHWYLPEHFSLFIANGVTGIRQMAGSPKQLIWRKQIVEGELIGPRMSIASPIVDGRIPIWPGSISVENKDQAKEVITKVKDFGADFIKIYSLLSPEDYFTIAAEAKKHNIVFAGHVPYGVSALEVSKAGQKSVEHMGGILLACSSDEVEQRQKILESLKTYTNPRLVTHLEMSIDQQVVDTYDNDKADILFKNFIENGTWVCPTLSILDNMATTDKTKFYKDPRLQYIHPYFKSIWKLSFESGGYHLDGKVYDKYRQVIKRMSELNVPFIAGTDVGNPYCFPGFSLHDELVLLVKSGFTPIQALQSVTINPARYLEKQSSLGSVNVGKKADLVLLDANPLEDIRHTKSINSVVFAGHLYAKTDLQKLLDKVAASLQK